MPTPLRPLRLRGARDDEGFDEESLHRLMLYVLNRVGVDGHLGGLGLRRTRFGLLTPGRPAPPRPDARHQIDLSTEVDRLLADEAAASFYAANVEAADRRRRPRIAPVRPPRPPRPIHAWDELGVDESDIPVPLFVDHYEQLDRERRAAEIMSPRELEEEPDLNTWPTSWETHHDYYLWACRGSVEVITDHLQVVFVFDPPLQEDFVSARLGGVNAYKQLTFLRKYLPGERHSMQRAEARGVLYEADISDPDVRSGTQKLDVRQTNPGSPGYIKPVLPCWGPRNWSRTDDAFAAMYLGDHPDTFLREYTFAFHATPSIEFVRIRMAQIQHLNLNLAELQAAKARRNSLARAYPSVLGVPVTDMDHNPSFFF